ncbi:MAG: TonB-dependent receptor, partial [Spartobacteria bacterium]
KAIIVERGSFRPVTYATNDMLDGARQIFLSQPEAKEEDLVVLMEMTLENLLSEGQLNHADFLARVDILGSLGRTVLISKFGEYYRLAGYLSRYTNQMVALVMGVPSLDEIFDEKYYLNLEGGILEALGRMFKGGLKLFVYPLEDDTSGALLTAKQLEVAPNLHHLYQYLIENGFIQEIENFHRDYLKIFPPDVLAKMRAGDPSWENMVPAEVSQMIKARGYFGYRASVAA